MAKLVVENKNLFDIYKNLYDVYENTLSRTTTYIAYRKDTIYYKYKSINAYRLQPS